MEEPKPDHAVVKGGIADTVARNKMTIAGLALLVLVVVATVLILMAHQKSQKPSSASATSNACLKASNGSLLKQAADNLAPENYSQLEKVVKQIKSLPDYQQDSNCLYILTAYYANAFDVGDAQKSLAAFNAVYNKNKSSLSPLLYSYQSATTLNTRVNMMQNNLKQQQRNTAIESGLRQ